MCPAVLQDERGAFGRVEAAGPFILPGTSPARHGGSCDRCAREHLSVSGDCLLGPVGAPQAPPFSPPSARRPLASPAHAPPPLILKGKDRAHFAEVKTGRGGRDVCPRSQNERVAELGREALMPGDSVSVNEHEDQCERTGVCAPRTGRAAGSGSRQDHHVGREGQSPARGLCTRPRASLPAQKIHASSFKGILTSHTRNTW